MRLFIVVKHQISIPLKLGLVRHDNNLCQTKISAFLSNYTHVNEKTSHSCVDNLLSSKSAMDSLKLETQFENIDFKVYGKVREANNRSLSYPNKYKLAKAPPIGQKVLLENHTFPFGKLQNLCDLRIGPHIATNVNMKVIHDIALDSDPTRSQVVHRNYLIACFPGDNELPNILSGYEKPFNDDKIELIDNEFATNRLSQLNPPIN